MVGMIPDMTRADQAVDFMTSYITEDIDTASTVPGVLEWGQELTPTSVRQNDGLWQFHFAGVWRYADEMWSLLSAAEELYTSKYLMKSWLVKGTGFTCCFYSMLTESESVS